MADELIDIDRVIEMESGWDEKAVGAAGERGLGQIMPIALKDYNNYNTNNQYTFRAIGII